VRLIDRKTPAQRSDRHFHALVVAEVALGFQLFMLGFGDENPRKSSCKRGWLTFELPPKTKIVSVEYSPSNGTPLTWQVR
jgi:hypothetical protein